MRCELRVYKLIPIMILVSIVQCKTKNAERSREVSEASVAKHPPLQLAILSPSTKTSVASNGNTLSLALGSEVYIANPPVKLMSELNIDAEPSYSKIAKSYSVDTFDDFDSTVSVVHYVSVNNSVRAVLQKYMDQGLLQVDNLAKKGPKLEFFGFLSELYNAVYNKVQYNRLYSYEFLSRDVISRNVLNSDMQILFEREFGDRSTLTATQLVDHFIKRFQIPEGTPFEKIDSFEYKSHQNTHDAYVLFPGRDENGAFSTASDLEDLLTLSLTHNIHFIRPKTKLDALEDISKLEQEGRTFDFWTLAGHAGPDGIQIGSGTERLNKGDFNPAGRFPVALNGILKEDATISIIGCNAGEQVDYDNFAEAVSFSTNRTTIAPIKEAFASDYYIVSPKRTAFAELATGEDYTVIISPVPKKFLNTNVYFISNDKKEFQFVGDPVGKASFLKELKLAVKQGVDIQRLTLIQIRDGDVLTALEGFYKNGAHVKTLQIEGLSVSSQKQLSLLSLYALTSAETKLSLSFFDASAFQYGSFTIENLNLKRVEGSPAQDPWWATFPKLQKFGADADFLMKNGYPSTIKQLTIYRLSADTNPSRNRMLSTDGKPFSFMDFLKDYSGSPASFVFHPTFTSDIQHDALAKAKELGLEVSFAANRISFYKK